MSQFQLFPPASPAKVAKNPFRRGNKKPTATPVSAASIPLDEFTGKDSGAEAVFVAITESKSNATPPPEAPISRPATASTPESVHVPRSSGSQPRPSQQEKRRHDAPVFEDSKSVTHGEDNVSSLSQRSSPKPGSPGIPIRSMFPRYNPDLPLNQQQYYPQTLNRSARSSPRPKNLTLSPASEIDRSLGPKTVPASVLNFPMSMLDPAEVQYSSSEELNSLWDAANGQRPQNIKPFNLHMTRTNPATFLFGDPERPFYTMQTFSTNEMSVTRSNPSRPNSNIPVMMLKIEDRQRRKPPNDGLVSLLFSRLAAMLAIDQAEESAKARRLTPTEAAELEAHALRRAAAQESCRLSWNSKKQVYELYHPSLTRPPPPALVGAAGIPLSPMRSRYAGILHITVSTPSNDSKHHPQPPVILVTTPLPVNSAETGNMAATPRTSTLPLTDVDEPLASLDLGTMSLSISAAAIIATVPSLYAIDSLVTAMLAVAISDETTNPVLADMELFDPHKPLNIQSPVSEPGTLYKGKLVATLAEREDALEGSDLVAQVKAQQSKNADEQKKWFRWGRSSKPTKPQPKSQKVVVEEFDLENYGRFGQGSSRQGEKLPGVTRGILRILFFGLNLIVRGLTVAVKVVAWLLVSLTRCFTSEKF
ncbi:hypothetical protein BDW42DRAFT_131360 [Aspergillus taichungensis]|uniref:Uncharacterized protein n=1 Tax=Aspergillus taichungensis TaxID=482145 RepID=A0A2J5I7F9_9EURO|nr:hypothetical protein BDW42DRAFT_131360 [Aspergillus taichungensis]